MMYVYIYIYAFWEYTLFIVIGIEPTVIITYNWNINNNMIMGI